LLFESIKEFNKPYLLGAHISEGNHLPSGEKIKKIINDIEHNKLIGNYIILCFTWKFWTQS